VRVQAAQAAQITCEDYLMRTRGVSPLQIVGWEGVYGLAAMVRPPSPRAWLPPGLPGPPRVAPAGPGHEYAIARADMVAIT
jgi:hypothetical protein